MSTVLQADTGEQTALELFHFEVFVLLSYMEEAGPSV